MAKPVPNNAVVFNTDDETCEEAKQQVDETASTNSSTESGYWSYRPSDIRWGETYSEDKSYPKLSSDFSSMQSRQVLADVQTVQPDTSNLHTQVRGTNHLWSDKILPRQGLDNTRTPLFSGSDRQPLSFVSDRQPLSSSSDRQPYSLVSDSSQLKISSDSEQFDRLNDRQVLDRSQSLAEPSVGRPSRMDLSRRSVSLAERHIGLRTGAKNSDRRSVRDRMTRDNILQMLTDRLHMQER